MYDPTYILTGDEQKLNFYNLLILTIMIIHKANVMFDSLDLLGEGFCETYIKLNKLKENQEEVKEKFNQAIEEACDVGLISVKSYSKKYFCWFREFDFVGLEQYLEEAKYYAEVILGENFSLDIEANIKKLRRTASKKV